MLPETFHTLLEVRAEVRKHGYNLVVRDGFRSVYLYQAIAAHRRQKGLRVEGLFNLKDMPHATGLAVDVSLETLDENPKPVWIRLATDGPNGEKFGFYAGKQDEQSRAFHQRQQMLLQAFARQNFELGSLRECWHFQSKRIDAKTPRY